MVTHPTINGRRVAPLRKIVYVRVSHHPTLHNTAQSQSFEVFPTCCMLQPLVNCSSKLGISNSHIQYIISSTMELCDDCAKIIQGALKCGIEGHVQDKLPCYPQLCKRSCWMCKRFITWMQATHPTLFKKWRGSPLTVISKLSSWATMRDGPCNPGHLLPCEVEIIPVFRGEVVDDYGCVIGMNFMSEEGKKRPAHYATTGVFKLIYQGQMFFIQLASPRGIAL